MEKIIKKLVYGVAILGTLYHLYLVIHPYMPFSHFRSSVLDLTQVQRATHVFLICLIGYLLSFVQTKKRKIGGGLPLAFLTGLIVFQFVQLSIPIPLKVFGVFIWGFTIIAPMIPPTQRFANIVCAALTFLPFLYLVTNYEQLIYRAIMPEPWDLVMALSEMMLVLGVIFRLSGPIMPIFVIVFFLYNLYGYVLPPMLANPGFDLDMLLGKMLLPRLEAGIFGTITGVSVKYLIYFTTLGAIISRMNFGKIIANIALLFVGRSPASPGRTSSIMAVLMGMFSGSGAADTQFVATLTKPLYDKVGYDRADGRRHHRHSRDHRLHHPAGPGVHLLSNGRAIVDPVLLDHRHGPRTDAPLPFRDCLLQRTLCEEVQPSADDAKLRERFFLLQTLLLRILCRYCSSSDDLQRLHHQPHRDLSGRAVRDLRVCGQGCQTPREEPIRCPVRRHHLPSPDSQRCHCRQYDHEYDGHERARLKILNDPDEDEW